MNDVITKGMSTISVKGKGHIDARPDEATLSVEVEKVSSSQEVLTYLLESLKYHFEVASEE